MQLHRLIHLIWDEYGIEETGNGAIFLTIVFLITFFGYWMKDKLLAQNPANQFFINISFISFLLWILRLISRTAERVTFYYMPSTYLVLEELVSSIKTKKDRNLIYFLVSAASIILFFYRLSYDKTLVPYHFFW